jgi:hypothetical protein
VKNAAMKKLFADPHFNVMDRLDIYIDDYSSPTRCRPRCSAAGEREVPQALRGEERGRRRTVPHGERKPPMTRRRNPWHSPAPGPSKHYRRPKTMPTLICDCNKTMPLDPKALGRRSR